MARHLIRIALVLALVAGCSSARQPAATAVLNATDVMFLQMNLAQIEEGDRETSWMEEAGGAYPPAKKLATAVTGRRQEQVGRLLRLAAAQ